MKGDELPVDGEGGSGQRPRTEGQNVDPAQAFGEALAVAAQHLEIGHEMMGKEDRLGGLQVGEAGHDDPQMLLRLVEEGCEQFVEVG